MFGIIKANNYLFNPRFIGCIMEVVFSGNTNGAWKITTSSFL